MNNRQINWKEVRENFEKDISLKLAELPGHKEATEDLSSFRSIISHELPETTSKEIYTKLINMLLSEVQIDLQKIKDEYLSLEVAKENKKLAKNIEKFSELKDSAKEWVNMNLSEKDLQDEWRNHKTWLPRRYTVYKDPNIPFQKIAADTLARYYLLVSNVKMA